MVLHQFFSGSLCAKGTWTSTHLAFEQKHRCNIFWQCLLNTLQERRGESTKWRGHNVTMWRCSNLPTTCFQNVTMWRCSNLPTTCFQNVNFLSCSNVKGSLQNHVVTTSFSNVVATSDNVVLTLWQRHFVSWVVLDSSVKPSWACQDWLTLTKD